MIAFVTGGTRGIGEAISIDLKKKGYTVIAAYASNIEKAKAFSKEHGIEVVACDVTDEQKCQETLHNIIQKHGTIDVLVHNAGITRDSFFHKMTSAQWHEVISTNLNSCFNVTRPVIEHMRQKNYGRIIVISSINGLKGQMGQTNYSAAKAGIIGFVKALSLENAAKGITVNAIAPGYIATEMVEAIDSKIVESIKAQIPVQRLGSPTEVAHAVCFLSDKLSGFITGETLNINGGQYLH
ncbi:MAG: acetoacetyl-CoA reductase [Proteobacteria bacterium]|nr:acetoacetyl-CoA reductase [Pseudomonadota bacterium]